MTSIYDKYFPVREMLFKTYVGKTLKYCIRWLNWNPKDLAMVAKSDLIGYTDEDLNNIKGWREYKQEIQYKSTFENYAIENKINLTCTYRLPHVVKPCIEYILIEDEEEYSIENDPEYKDLPELIDYVELPQVNDEEIPALEPYVQPQDCMNIVNFVLTIIISILHIIAFISTFF